MRMKRRLLIIFLIALPIAAGLVWLLGGQTRSGLSVTGDLAGDITREVRRNLPGAVTTANPAQAALEIVAVTEWSKLAFVPGAVADCGDPCQPESANRLVRVISFAPGGSRKQVYVNIDWALSGDALDQSTFVLSQAGAACLGQLLASEVTQLRGQADRPADCPQSLPSQTRWRLALP